MNANEKHGCHGGNGSTTPEPVPILTAEDAHDVASGIEWWGLNPQQSSRAGYALDAIANGTAVVIDASELAELRRDLADAKRERDEWAAKWSEMRRKYAELRFPELTGKIIAQEKAG